jgi:hypothetical protein
MRHNNNSFDEFSQFVTKWNMEKVNHFFRSFILHESGKKIIYICEDNFFENLNQKQLWIPAPAGMTFL